MPGELRTRRRRRGGRGRGRRRGSGRRLEQQTGPAAAAGSEGAAGAAPGAEVPAGTASAAPDSSGLEPEGREVAEPAREPDYNGGPEPVDAEGAPADDTLEPPAAVEPLPAPDASRPVPHERAQRKARAPRRRRERTSGRRRRGREAAPGEPQEEAAAAAAQPAPSERPRHRHHESPEKTLVINGAPQETRVAILEKGILAEVFIEREDSRGVVGNIYKGRVTKVLPGMQSAFVAVGLERDAFLYVSDISPGYAAYEGLLDLDEVEGGDAIREAAPKFGRSAKIEELLKEGQELLVQVTKEPIGTKGARITSYVTIPGRFLVLMPQVDHVGVSRKIGDARERARLRKIVDRVRPAGMGFIVRTVADGCEVSELEADANYLISLWEETRKKGERVQAPAEIHRELSIVPKVLRDLLNRSVTKVIIDDERRYREARDLVSKLQPDLLGRLMLYRESFPVFEKYGVQAELDKALRSRVWLKSGGYIVINQTEALVAIDVNTGKYVGKRSLEDTVLKTNLEAVTEICRQLRLRDLGGIIVVDFIDMEERKSKKKLFDAFEGELQKDRARTKVLQISDFGLIEITRQRTKKSLERILCQTCPYCSGTGKIKASATVLFEIQRELQKLAPNLDGKRLIIRANPDVARHLESDRRLLSTGIVTLDHVDMAIRADSTLHHEQFDIVSL